MLSDVGELFDTKSRGGDVYSRPSKDAFDVRHRFGVRRGTMERRCAVAKSCLIYQASALKSRNTRADRVCRH